MSDETVNLSLPYILPSQAQKHVTHNEALQRLDAVVQLVIAESLATPPDAPPEGACYLVDDAAAGPWTGKSGQLAFRQDGAWIYVTPQEGWRAWFAASGELQALSGGQWRPVSLPADGKLSMLGINASPDETNRLALASPASLFSHAGNGHQIKVNKAATTDTGSLLFQTGWSGRAEMGLAGSDDFTIKVSADGDSWRTGLLVSQQGSVTRPSQPVAKAFLTAGTMSPTSGSQSGFDTLAIAQGGFGLGAAIAAGPGNRLVVPATGLYLLFLSVSAVSSSGNGVKLVANGTSSLAEVASPPTTAASRQGVSALAMLSAGDTLSLLHSGAAQLATGDGQTEVLALLL